MIGKGFIDFLESLVQHHKHTGTDHSSTLGTGVVTSDMILDGTIVNADVNASAAIVVSKLAAGTFPAGAYVFPTNSSVSVTGTGANVHTVASSSAASITLATYLAASLTSGNEIDVKVGLADSTDNSMYLRWHHDTTAASRYGALGLTGQSPLIYLTQTGLIGVKTATPGQVVGIYGTNAAAATSGSAQNGALRIMSSSALIMDLGADGSNGAWIQARNSGNYATNYPLLLNPNGGNVGIGTTGPEEKLHIVGNMLMGYTGKILFERSDGANSGQIYMDGASAASNMIINPASGTGTVAIQIDSTTRLFVAATGAWSGSFYGAGTATFDASGNITSVSDERHKIAIRPFYRGLADLLHIRPITYKYNELSGMEMEHEYTGFSAQNVMQSIPEAVFENSEGFYSFSDRPVLAAAVNAIKELDARLTKAGIA